MTERHRSIVDVSLVLRRDGRVLMLRRGRAAFAAGMLCLPSGHLEHGESVVEAVIREAREEIGVRIDPSVLRLGHVVHHTDAEAPDVVDRVGLFFEAETFHGEPVNAEPHKCDGLVWVDPGDLPDDVVPYQAVGLTGFLGGGALSLHGWE